MKRSWFVFIAFMLAAVSQEVVLNLVHFEYHLLRDPFSPAKLAVEFGTFVGFFVAYSVGLGYFWKPWQDS